LSILFIIVKWLAGIFNLPLIVTLLKLLSTNVYFYLQTLKT